MPFEPSTPSEERILLKKSPLRFYFFKQSTALFRISHAYILLYALVHLVSSIILGYLRFMKVLTIMRQTTFGLFTTHNECKLSGILC